MRLVLGLNVGQHASPCVLASLDTRPSHRSKTVSTLYRGRPYVFCPNEARHLKASPITKPSSSVHKPLIATLLELPL